MDRLIERFELLRKRVFDEDFLYRNRTIIPYFLFVYDPDKEYWMNEKIEGLLHSAKEKGNEFQVVNLFDVFLNIFEDDIEDLVEIEHDQGISELLDAVGPALDDSIVDCFTSLTEGTEVVLLNGIGTAHPYIHVSGMLKRLSTSGYMKPIIVFYPGTFNGMELSLFNRSNIIEDEYQIYVIA